MNFFALLGTMWARMTLLAPYICKLIAEAITPDPKNIFCSPSFLSRLDGWNQSPGTCLSGFKRQITLRSNTGTGIYT